MVSNLISAYLCAISKTRSRLRFDHRRIQRRISESDPAQKAPGATRKARSIILHAGKMRK
jgi:hypothetical protein